MTLKELTGLLGPPCSTSRWQQACDLLQQAYAADPDGFEARWLDPIRSLVEQVPAHMRLCHPRWYQDALKGSSHPGLQIARVWYPMAGPGFSDKDALAAMRLAPNPGPDALAVLGSEGNIRQRWLDAWPHPKALRVLSLENTYRGDPAAMILPESIKALGLCDFVLSDVNPLPELRMLCLEKIKRPVQKGELLPLAGWAANLEGLSLREVSSKLVLEWLSTLDFPNLTHLAISNLSGTESCNDELFRLVLERLPRLRVLRLSRYKDDRAMASLRGVLPRLRERTFDVLALHDASLAPEMPEFSRWEEGYHPLEERLNSLSRQNGWLSQHFYPPASGVNQSEVDWS
jgi:hypothetical protein